MVRCFQKLLLPAVNLGKFAGKTGLKKKEHRPFHCCGHGA
jgi:hypothetical protein